MRTIIDHVECLEACHLSLTPFHLFCLLTVRVNQSQNHAVLFFELSFLTRKPELHAEGGGSPQNLVQGVI